MSSSIIFFICLVWILRLPTLFYSIKNEKKLQNQGAIQYGKLNSLLMTILHFTYYITTIIEGAYRKTTFDNISEIGLIFFGVGYFFLMYVIIQLKNLWTVKIYIAPQHNINKSFLFKYVKHPNYYLSIIPELIGVGMLCKAWYTMIFILPLYAIVMIVRIIQEEKAMKSIH